MAMTGDMNVGAGDMAVVAPLYAQITVADVVGTAYVPGASPSASPIPVAGTHVLATTVSFPSAANPASPANPFGGCTINRYDASVGNLAAPDSQLSPVTITGYTYVAGIDAANPLVPSPSPTLNAMHDCKWLQMPVLRRPVGYWKCQLLAFRRPDERCRVSPRLPFTHQPPDLVARWHTVVETMDVGSNTTPYVAITTGSIQLSTSDDQFFITSIVSGQIIPQAFPPISPLACMDDSTALTTATIAPGRATVRYRLPRVIAVQPLIAGLTVQTQQETCHPRPSSLA